MTVTPQMGYFYSAQKSTDDCGYACLKMVLGHYGISYDYSLKVSNQISLEKLVFELNSNGLFSVGVKMDLKNLLLLKKLPCIVHYKKKHFVVIYEINQFILLGDPLEGIEKLSIDAFCNQWLIGNSGNVILIFGIQNR